MNLPIFVQVDDNITYYLILGAIYLISRLLKKKKPVATPSSNQQPREETRQYEPEPKAVPQAQPRPQRPQQPTSFEDLLKEISHEFSDRKKPEPREIVIEEPTPKAVVPEEKEKTREQLYVERRHREEAEKKKQKELIRLAEEEEEHEQHSVLEILQEDGGAANAVVLSEILNRRY